MSTTRNDERVFAKTMLSIGLVAAFVCVMFSHANHDYELRKDRNVAVLDKISIGGRSSHFYLILKEERGIVFDLSVSPATYSQTKVGDRKIFSLRQMQIRQTALGNTLGFLWILFGSVALVTIVVGTLALYSSRKTS